MVISCLVNIVQGGGGEVLPRFGMLENSPKTVKCVITFETDCSFFILCDAIFLARLQGKFEIDNSWEWMG